MRPAMRALWAVTSGASKVDPETGILWHRLIAGPEVTEYIMKQPVGSFGNSYGGHTFLISDEILLLIKLKFQHIVPS